METIYAAEESVDGQRPLICSQQLQEVHVQGVPGPTRDPGTRWS